MLFRVCCALSLVLSAVCAQAADNDEVEGYVSANLLSILYHELGHAIIDLKGLPVFGQEEDAADVASVLLVDLLFDEEDAVGIAYESAFGFLAEAEHTGGNIAWWDEHGPDLQRYYNLICLFTGAAPEEREDIAEDLGLPEERFDVCPFEFEIAIDSWGPVFDELAETAPGKSFVYIGGSKSLTEQVISDEVAALNKDFVMPQDLLIKVEACGQANAFYDPQVPEIVICTEFEDWLRDNFSK